MKGCSAPAPREKPGLGQPQDKSFTVFGFGQPHEVCPRARDIRTHVPPLLMRMEDGANLAPRRSRTYDYDARTRHSCLTLMATCHVTGARFREWILDSSAKQDVFSNFNLLQSPQPW